MPINPKPGEIWWIEFEPQVGEEIMKTRPAVVLSISDVSHLNTRYVVPIRDFKDFHAGIYYYIPVIPDNKNGLKKKSSVDCNQAKSVSLKRFSGKIGTLKKEEIKELAKTVSFLMGHLEDEPT
jgi:mRNA interferase MazF